MIFTVHFGGPRGAVGLLCVVANYSRRRGVGGAFSCICDFVCLSVYISVRALTDNDLNCPRYVVYGRPH